MVICHTADWHLGASGNRLDSETGLNGAMMDRARCARFVIEDGIRRGGQLVLMAGDVFQGHRPTPTEVRLAREVFAPAQAAGVPVVLLKGNHDDVRSPIEQHALDLLRDMEGVTVVDRPTLLTIWSVGGGYAVGCPRETGEDFGDSAALLQVACLPYPNRQLLLQSEEARNLSPADLNQLVREKMMDVARGLAAQRVAGVPAVLLGHFAVDTAAAGKQNSLAMLSSEWTLNVHELTALGFTACLLGHYHRGQTLASAPIWYSGSPEACSFGEEEEGKHYCIVEPVADPDRPGCWNVRYQEVFTPYRHLVTFDASALTTDLSELQGAIVRLQVPAAMADRASQIRGELEAAGAVEVRVEIEHAESVRRREVEITAQSDLGAALDGYLAQHPDYQPLRDELLGAAREVEAQMGGEM